MKYRAPAVRLPKLPANKTATAIAEKRQALRAKQARVCLYIVTSILRSGLSL